MFWVKLKLHQIFPNSRSWEILLTSKYDENEAIGSWRKKNRTRKQKRKVSSISAFPRVQLHTKFAQLCSQCSFLTVFCPLGFRRVVRHGVKRSALCSRRTCLKPTEEHGKGHRKQKVIWNPSKSQNKKGGHEENCSFCVVMAYSECSS